MKKYLTLILLIVTLNSYSQVDSTKVWEARKEWLSNPDNYSNGQQMPNWDLNGNIIPIISLLTFLFYYKNKTNQHDSINNTNTSRI